MGRFTIPGLGWHQSLRDFRDLTPESHQFRTLVAELEERPESKLPETVDLREYFLDVQHQQQLNAATAHASVALYEYFQLRAKGTIVEPSRLFLYYTARKLSGAPGDCGADLRSALKAMTCFGVPPERYWPYDLEKWDATPDAFLFSFAAAFRSIRYVRLDAGNATGAETLQRVKEFLTAGFPVAFGFPVPNSVSSDSEIPYRPSMDLICGGQAVVAVGYDDRRRTATRGALLIRNSWGSQWGENGYGWLPYRYVEQQMASDFWTLLAPEWLESGEFSRPRIGALNSTAARSAQD